MRQEGAREDGVPVVEVVDAATMEDAAVEIARLAHEDDARGQARECWAGLARDCAAGKALALVARRGTRIRGALALRSLAGTGPGRAHRVEIGAFAVGRDEGGADVASALLARVEQEARRLSASLLTIELRQGDPHAALLRARGFRLSGRIPGGAGPGIDALLFWKDLSAGAPPPLPAPPQRDDVEVLAHDRLFRSYLALDRFELRHRLFAGGTSAVVGRDLVVRGPAAAILLYDPDCDQVALVEQFRVGALAAGMDPWILETVAGVVEPGEDAAEVARREALEEAGAQVGEMERIARYLSSPGCSDETVESFVGRVDASRLGGLHGLPEEGEDIRVVVMDASTAIAACADGRIGNAITLVALQWLALNRAALAARWRRA
jgi:ADP-ribose pyrophosphatase